MAARRTRQPVVVVEPHPKAWEEARKLAEGRAVRLVAQPDGTVLIVNQPDR